MHFKIRLRQDGGNRRPFSRDRSREARESPRHIIPTMTNIAWEQAGEFEDIRYEKAEGIAKITINRPEVRNAFRR